MRAAILSTLAIAIAAAAFATPSLAASTTGQPHLKSCNKKADANGISGRARSEMVQEFMQPSKTRMKTGKPTTKRQMG